MALSPGEKLGPYQILAAIGAGGMGEVYKARDTRVDRTVAIKVSKEKFSERFEREARAIAALNHPHICQLYDVGPNYLVMEFIEGVPLKGPLRLDKTLLFAAQICDALDAAHTKNLTHRDLKPANILVTKAGVKLLDFGLAKMAPAVKADESTQTMTLTHKGEILGTLRYMSPEQVNGQDAGPRSDIFSFGLVLYEMLTGKRALDGATPASVIAAILERPAPSVAGIAPSALDRVLKRCLERDPENRWQSARDLKAELEWIASTPEPARASSSGSRLWRWIGIAAAAAAVIAVGMGVGWWRAMHPLDAPLKPLVRLEVDLGPDVLLNAPAGALVALSPDGTRLVYASGNRLFTRRLDQAKATELSDTEGGLRSFLFARRGVGRIFRRTKSQESFGRRWVCDHLGRRRSRLGRQLGRRRQHHRGSHRWRAVENSLRWRRTCEGHCIVGRRERPSLAADAARR
jgi:serine/threonine protein kinase